MRACAQPQAACLAISLTPSAPEALLALCNAQLGVCGVWGGAQHSLLPPGHLLPQLLRRRHPPEYRRTGPSGSCWKGRPTHIHVAVLQPVVLAPLLRARKRLGCSSEASCPAAQRHTSGALASAAGAAPCRLANGSGMVQSASGSSARSASLSESTGPWPASAACLARASAALPRRLNAPAAPKQAHLSGCTCLHACSQGCPGGPAAGPRVRRLVPAAPASCTAAGCRRGCTGPAEPAPACALHRESPSASQAVPQACAREHARTRRTLSQRWRLPSRCIWTTARCLARSTRGTSSAWSSWRSSRARSSRQGPYACRSKCCSAACSRSLAACAPSAQGVGPGRR